MAAPSELVARLGKSDKKRDKKLKRITSIVKKRYDIAFSTSPTSIIFIGNAGFTTGTQPEDIIGAFLEYGPVVNITMIPGESFCFVEFLNAHDANIALIEKHGKSTWQFGRPLYMAFVTRVPVINSIAQFPEKNIPQGLKIVPDVVTKEDAKSLLNSIDWANTEEENILRHRRVKHFGFRFCYDTNNVDRKNPLLAPFPLICTQLLTRLHGAGIIQHMPDQLTVNEYQPGQGIPSHIDTHSPFEEEILSLSLGAQIVMEFKSPDGSHRQIFLPERSLMIMTGESRYFWSHGITPRKTDIIEEDGGGLKLSHRGVRTSFTFRKLRSGPCKCNFKEQCDSQKDVPIIAQMKEATVCQPELVAQKLEDLHVHKVYDEIASHFSSTRHKQWPKITSFIQSLTMGSLVLDVGCGNGKYLHGDKTLFKVGCDRSPNLVNICRDLGFQAFCCDALALPIKSEFFDACICIAVIHHMSTMERRVKAIEELERILRPGGQALIYVWAVEQKLGNKESNYLKGTKASSSGGPQAQVLSTDLCSDKDSSHLCNLPIHVNRTEFEHRDLLVPWHHKPKDDDQQPKSNVLHRYYHVFAKGELEDICAKVHKFQLKDSYYDEGNWCVLLQKTKFSQ